MANWTASDIPSLTGRNAVVTGTGGLGFQTALMLAKAGAEVILAGRSFAKGAAAVEQIGLAAPRAKIRFEVLDLASLVSIKAFSNRIAGSMDHLDLLINNAGVMTPPQRKVTVDGFELQLGTNHLGHFALTAHLLELLRKGEASRVVTVSSIAARQGKLNLKDLQSERDYDPMVAYSQSKLACLMFALDLHRRSQSAGWGIQSIAAHPGVSRTELLPNGAGASSAAGIARRALWFLFQPAAQGALPTLFAATAPHAVSGAYYGPSRLGETRGYPTLANMPVQALEQINAAKLWKESEWLTGAAFPTDDEKGASRRRMHHAGKSPAGQAA